MKAILLFDLEIGDNPAAPAEVLTHVDPPTIPYFAGMARIAIGPNAQYVTDWLDANEVVEDNAAEATNEVQHTRQQMAEARLALAGLAERLDETTYSELACALDDSWTEPDRGHEVSHVWLDAHDAEKRAAVIAEVRAVYNAAAPHGQYERFDEGHLSRWLLEQEGKS